MTSLALVTSPSMEAGGFPASEGGDRVGAKTERKKEEEEEERARGREGNGNGMCVYKEKGGKEREWKIYKGKRVSTGRDRILVKL